MTEELLKFISEYNSEKMIMLHELLESVKRIAQDDVEEAKFAVIGYRSALLNFDEKAFENALPATHFEINEQYETVNGSVVSMKDVVRIFCLNVNKEVADYFFVEAEKFF